MRRAAQIAVGLLVLLLVDGNRARSADPQPYVVTLAPTGDAALDQALHDASTLATLRETAPVGPFALTARAQQDVTRFLTVLHGFGYYKAQVDVRIAGRAPDDSGLETILEQAPADPPTQVSVAFTPGPQFHLGQVAIDGTVPPDAVAKLDLATGAPAIAQDVLDGQTRLLAALRGDGYALAKVDLPPVTLHDADNAVDLRFVVTSGPRVDLGPISVEGLQQTNEAFVQRRLMVHPGEQFNPDAIEAARQDLLSLGVFSDVRAVPADQLNPQGQLPVAYVVTERKLHAVDLGVSYSTDLGFGVNGAWHHRNLFGNAEQLNLTAAFQAGGSAQTGAGYQVGAQFIKPDFLARDQSLTLNLGALKQNLQAYDQKAITEGAGLSRLITPQLTASIGVTGEQEQITQEAVLRHYDLIGLPIGLKYDNTNSLLDPTHGWRGAATVTPTQSLLAPSATFTLLQVAGSTYIDFSGSGRSVLALRGLVGQLVGADQFSVPPDQRFYAGGSATVRGFKYQSIGPLFPDGRPQGGTSVAAGTVEFRQRFLEHFGVVAFVDAGQANASGGPFSGIWRIGAGVGARYYTSFGPIRLDVAVPLNRTPGGDAFELYIGIGQAF